MSVPEYSLPAALPARRLCKAWDALMEFCYGFQKAGVECVVPNQKQWTKGGRELTKIASHAGGKNAASASQPYTGALKPVSLDPDKGPVFLEGLAEQ